MAERHRPELSGEERLVVGLLQTAPLFGDVTGNLDQLVLARAEVPGARVAVSAELSATGYGFDPHDDGSLLDGDDPRLAVLPPGTGVGYAERSPGRLPFNAYAVVGTPLPVQHKLHPVSYAPWNEHLSFEPGDHLGVGSLDGVRVATLVCNDMWHPVMPWYAVHAGAEVLLVPVASLDGGDVRRTWHTILEHTARVLQCYVVFVNRCGPDGGATFWGGSCVLGPSGEVLCELGRQPATAEVELDLAYLRRLRRDVPILRESRPDLVRGLLAGAVPLEPGQGWDNQATRPA